MKPRLTITSLVRPLFLVAWQKPPYIFVQKKNPLQYGHFFWAHSVTVLTRFHCTAKYTQYTVDRKKLFKVVTSHQVVWIVLVKFKQTPPGFAAHLQLHSLFSQRSEWTLSNPQNFAFSLFPVSPGYYHDYSRSKRNRRRWLCKPWGGGVNKVHYSLCEKGEWQSMRVGIAIKIERTQIRFLSDV